MKLHSLRVRNFRCYENEISIEFSDLTALVGRNDAGKSTLLEALEIFLEDGVPDKDDASKSGNPKELTIVCEFNALPTHVVIDEENATSLEEEFLLNAAGRLEIHKTYSGHLAAPKLASVQICAIHPTASGAADLVQLTNPKLKKRAKDLGASLDGINKSINAQLRKRIREHQGELEVAPTLISLDKDNGKNVWNGLRRILPAFALFKSDRASTDQDPEAQDPLKAAVKEAIKAKEEELDAIALHVEEEVRKIAQLTLDKLSEMDPTLATELVPKFAKPRWESLFKASITGDEDIPINKRGSGVKRLILLNFFRAKAEQMVVEKNRQAVIYAIEEPETSQHPLNQRMLMRALSDLSAEAQVIVSTHTPMLARSIDDQNLRFVRVAEDGKRTILTGGPETNEEFSRSLGVLPDNNVKLFVGVEGKHDIAFLQAISKVLRASGEKVPDLLQLELDGQVVFFPLGGSTLLLWTTRLQPLGRPEIHLYDRDTTPPAEPKYIDAMDAVNARGGCTAKCTSKRELENYLHWEAINAAYAEIHIDLQLSKNFADFDDVPAEVARLVHEKSGSTNKWEELTDEKRKKKESKAKRQLNWTATKHMNSARLTASDSQSEIVSWLQEIANCISQ